MVYLLSLGVLYLCSCGAVVIWPATVQPPQQLWPCYLTYQCAAYLIESLEALPLTVQAPLSVRKVVSAAHMMSVLRLFNMH
jgi:hypothetical protein